MKIKVLASLFLCGTLAVPAAMGNKGLGHLLPLFTKTGLTTSQVRAISKLDFDRIREITRLTYHLPDYDQLEAIRQLSDEQLDAIRKLDSEQLDAIRKLDSEQLDVVRKVSSGQLSAIRQLLATKY